MWFKSNKLSVGAVIWSGFVCGIFLQWDSGSLVEILMSVGDYMENCAWLDTLISNKVNWFKVRVLQVE